MASLGFDWKKKQESTKSLMVEASYCILGFQISCQEWMQTVIPLIVGVHVSQFIPSWIFTEWRKGNHFCRIFPATTVGTPKKRHLDFSPRKHFSRFIGFNATSQTFVSSIYFIASDVDKLRALTGFMFCYDSCDQYVAVWFWPFLGGSSGNCVGVNFLFVFPKLKTSPGVSRLISIFVHILRNYPLVVIQTWNGGISWNICDTKCNKKKTNMSCFRIGKKSGRCRQKKSYIRFTRATELSDWVHSCETRTVLSFAAFFCDFQRNFW